MFTLYDLVIIRYLKENKKFDKQEIKTYYSDIGAVESYKRHVEDNKNNENYYFDYRIDVHYNGKLVNTMEGEVLKQTYCNNETFLR